MKVADDTSKSKSECEWVKISPGSAASSRFGDRYGIPFRNPFTEVKNVLIILVIS